MRAKALKRDGGEITWVLVFDRGDPVVTTLTAFARQHAVGAAHFTAIGAFSRAKLGYFRRETKDYKEIPLDEQVEILSLIGDVALDKGEPKVHAHAALGTADGTARGGHATAMRRSRWTARRRPIVATISGLPSTTITITPPTARSTIGPAPAATNCGHGEPRTSDRRRRRGSALAGIAWARHRA